MSRNTTKPTKWLCAQWRLFRVFTVRMKKAWVLSYPLSAQQRLWSDWADAQADLSLRCAHSHFVGFVMSRLFKDMRLQHTHNALSSILDLFLWEIYQKINFKHSAVILRNSGFHKRNNKFNIHQNLHWLYILITNALTYIAKSITRECQMLILLAYHNT